MKKAMFLIFLLLGLFILMSCRKKDEQKKPVIIDKSYLKEDINDIKTDITGQNLKISWKTKEFKYIDYIELYEIIGDNYHLLKKYSIVNEYEYNTVIPIFEKKQYAVNVVYKNGEKGKYHIVDAFAKYKNIIIDNIMGEKVHIYLPKNYNPNNSKIIYILGSNDVFDSKNGENWEIENVLNELKEKNGIEDIVVASIIQDDIEAGYLKYIPYIDESVYEKYGIKESKSEEYYNFIKNKFIPAFERKYFYSNKNKENRMLIGYKEAGLFALWVGLNNQTFGNIAVFSPILWPERNRILFEYNKNIKNDNQKIWLERDIKDWGFYSERRLLDIMMQSGYKYGKNLFYIETSDKKMKDKIISPIIVFNDKISNKLNDIEINFEIINYKMKDRIKKDFMINSIAVYDCGIKYLIYKEAEYRIFNSNGAYIDFEGNFKFLKEEDAVIMVKYGSLSKKITIKYDIIKKYLENSGD